MGKQLTIKFEEDELNELKEIASRIAIIRNVIEERKKELEAWEKELLRWEGIQNYVLEKLMKKYNIPKGSSLKFMEDGTIIAEVFD
ncbi:MAG: hypothetical protein QXI11_09405, partial [Thermoproteota archaeon]